MTKPPGRTQALHGTWPSPVSPTLLAGALRLSAPVLDRDGTVVWREGRGGEGVLPCRGPLGGAPRDLGGGLNVRGRVGYGGGDHTLHRGTVFFAAEGRLYRQEAGPGGGEPVPVTPDFGGSAAPAVSPDGRSLAFVHTFEGVDTIAVAAADGSQWPRRLARGHDFYMQPTFDPTGRRLAYVAWDHPDMPWDGTELYLASLDTPEEGCLPRITEERVVAGDASTSVLNPVFSPDGETLAFASDRTGFWHVHLHDLRTGETRQLTSGDAEHALPAWVQGQSRMGFSPDGRTIHAIRSERGFDRLVSIDLESAELREHTELNAQYTCLDDLRVQPEGGRVAFVASSSTSSPRVVLVQPDAGAPQVLVRAGTETLDPAGLSRPEPVSWSASDGDEVYGLYYPPATLTHEGTGLPPLVVNVHGGPTSHARAGWNPAAQFFATRGFGFLDVNHRGSTGYGRAYAQALRGGWGAMCAADAIAGARALSERGVVHPERRVITGGSAGGLTALSAMILEPGFFSAAIVRYAVTNLFTLATDTHKFEARYLDSLVGPLPEAADLYRARSPLFHAERVSRPVAIFQGLDDKVVPPAQAEAIVAALRRNGVPHVYEAFEGEGHGFRRRETIEMLWETIEAFLLEYVIYA